MAIHRCLIVFAREPKKGAVKTRLGKDLSSHKVLYLYKAFLNDTLNLAKKISCQEHLLAYASESTPRYLKRIGKGFAFYRQEGKNLGERMLNAFRVAEENFAAIHTVIIGTDSPHLPAKTLKRAFQLLKRFDLVLGPSEDGGFYLIGLKSPAPGLFKGVRWSTREVLRRTVQNARRMKFKTRLLETLYDIDTIEDLQRLKDCLCRHKYTAPATWQVMKNEF